MSAALRRHLVAAAPPPPGGRIYVGNVAYDVTPASLLALFSRFGDIIAPPDMPLDATAGHHKGVRACGSRAARANTRGCHDATVSAMYAGM